MEVSNSTLGTLDWWGNKSLGLRQGFVRARLRISLKSGLDSRQDMLMKDERCCESFYIIDIESISCTDISNFCFERIYRFCISRT